MMMRFTVFGKPTGKGRPRFTRAGHAYTPEGTKAYEQEVRAAFLRACPGTAPIPAGTPVKVDILAFYAIPGRAPKAQKARMRAGELLPTVKPDWDNVGKIICDALNGLAWEDDAQVVSAAVEKRYGVEPMVCVRIEGCGA